LKVQVTEVGVQEKVTRPLNPFVGASESVTLPAVCPAATLTVFAEAWRVKLPAAAAGGATAIEPKRPPFSPSIPAAKYSVLGSPNVVVCPVF
jgi:hypothetical protein